MGRRGGGGRGNSSEQNSSLELTISANLNWRRQIYSGAEAIKAGPASSLLPPSFPPQSLSVVVSVLQTPSVFSRQGHCCQFCPEPARRGQTHFTLPAGEFPLSYLPSPSPPSALKWGGEAAGGKTLGAEGAIVTEPHFQLCPCRSPPPFLPFSFPSFSSLSLSFPFSNPLNALTTQVFLRAPAPRA